MEEYRQLRTEVTGLLSRIELLFRYSLLAVATVSAWLLANSMSVTQSMDPCVKLPKALLYFGWSIPPIFVVCSGLMASITNVRVRQIGEYLTKLEERLGAADLGWERDLSKKESILTNTTTRLWWGLFAFSAIASGVGLVTVFLATGSCPVAK
jgi:hypothetical protein